MQEVNWGMGEQKALLEQGHKKGGQAGRCLGRGAKDKKGKRSKGVKKRQREDEEAREDRGDKERV